MNGRDEIDPEDLHQEGCEYGRSLNNRVHNLEESVEDVVENLKDRPSWTIAIMLTTMSSIITGLSVALLTINI